MQAQSVKSIVQEIDAHMQSSGYVNASWYVGITSDIEERLFGYHKVPRNGYWYIYRRAFNVTDARNIEAAYHRAGCEGAGGGGDRKSVHVYAYVISPKTCE